MSLTGDSEIIAAGEVRAGQDGVTYNFHSGTFNSSLKKANGGSVSEFREKRQNLANRLFSHLGAKKVRFDGQAVVTPDPTPGDAYKYCQEDVFRKLNKELCDKLSTIVLGKGTDGESLPRKGD